MDIDPIDTIEKNRNSSTSRLNMYIAVTVAILASFMGIYKVKDDNIVQSMQQAQANKIDHWAFYQARNIREEIAKSTLVQLRLAMTTVNTDKANYQPAIDEYEKVAADQRQKKEELRKQAEQDQIDYDAANYRDDQFDLSDALIAISISLLAIAALTQQWWLYLLTFLPSSLGVLMGLAGFFGWKIHPDALMRLLS